MLSILFLFLKWKKLNLLFLFLNLSNYFFWWHVYVMKTFYKSFDNCLSVEVRSDSGSVLHAYLFIVFKKEVGGNYPTSFICHNIDMTPVKFVTFQRTMSALPLHILLKRCLNEFVDGNFDLDFELR